MSQLRLRFRKNVPALQFHHDIGMVSLGFGMAFLFCLALFELFNVQFHWIGGLNSNPVNVAGMHGSAQQSAEKTGSDLLFTAEKGEADYTTPGQKDVPLLKFGLSPSTDGFVRGMTFTLDDLAHPFDLKSLKLFLGDQSLGEVSFFEGKGVFANLMVKLAANKLMEFSVTGAVSDQAQIGDRLRLKMNDMRASDANGYEYNKRENGATGPAISVVRGRI